VVGSGNTHAWVTLREQSDCGWRLLLQTWWLLSVGGEAEAQADTPLDIKEPSVPGAARGAENAGG